MPTTSNEEYIPRDDESEAQRYQDLTGQGEVLYMNDEDVKSYAMSEFGLGFDNGSR